MYAQTLPEKSDLWPPSLNISVLLRMEDSRESEDVEMDQEDANIQREEYQGEEKV
jgi:hypothetical protein